MNKANNGEASHSNEKKLEKYEDAEKSTKHQAGESEPTKKEMLISSDGGIVKLQLKEFILETVKGRYEEGSKLSFSYTKPYTKRIDSLRMPTGYQPLKFQQFDGREIRSSMWLTLLKRAKMPRPTETIWPISSYDP